MKRNLLFIIVASLCMLASRAGVITHSETFSPSNWSFLADTVDSTPYTHVTYDGLDYISEPGKPQLPVKYVQLMVPYNATNITVSCSYSLRRTRVLDAKILPVEVPQVADETASETPVIAEDSTIYGVDAQFPAVRAEVVSDGYFMGDNRVITLAFYPMQYNPISGQVAYYSGLSASVSYDLGTAPANVLHRNNTSARNEDLTMLAEMVVNPLQIQAFKAPASHNYSQGDNATHPLVESYDYTIITTRDLKPAFKRLIALKRQKGYSAGAVCIEDIMQNPNVNGGDSIFDANNNLVSVIADSAGVIRQYLKRAFENGTRYVLMGGDNIPFRYGYADSNSSYPNAYDLHHKQVPTDWYYSELNTNWNIDGDNWYGEYTILDSILDNQAELYVGRIMFTTSESVNNYTDKLLRYELNPGNGDCQYLNNFSISECDNFKTAEILKPYYKAIWPNDTIHIQEAESIPSAYGVLNDINTNKYGIVSFNVHANPWAFFVNYINKREAITKDNNLVYPTPNVNTVGIDQLTNKLHPFIIYSYGCEPVPFDIYTQYSGRTYSGLNIGQVFTLDKDKGGIALFGNTRDGYVSRNHELIKSSLLEKCFLSAIKSKHFKAGEAESFSKNLYNGKTKSYICFVHNLIGEPEFDIWTDKPQLLGQYSFSYSDNSINISVNENLTDSIFIGICNNDTSFIKHISNADYTIDEVSPNSILMLYNHDAYPIISSLKLQKCEITNSQYVITPSVLIGENTDINRMQGEVIIKEGVTYELETKRGAEIASGFSVEKGATFSVSVSRDFYLR